MHEAEAKIRNTKNLGVVSDNDLGALRRFYDNLIKQANTFGIKTLLTCLESSDKFLRFRYEKLDRDMQEKLALEGAYLKHIQRTPYVWIIYYFTCKYGVYFPRPHRKIYENINMLRNSIPKEAQFTLTSNHLIVPATLRTFRKEIGFNLPALRKKITKEDIYVTVHLSDNKAFIKRVPFSPSKLRLDGKTRISVPIAEILEGYSKDNKYSIELVLNLRDYGLDKRETILDADAKRLYSELKTLVHIPVRRLTYNLGEGDIDIKYNGKNIKIELTRMDFTTNMRKSMANKLIVGRIAIDCLKYPQHTHLFIFHKKNAKIVKRLEDIISHFKPIIILSDFKNFKVIAKDIINTLSIPKVSQ